MAGRTLEMSTSMFIISNALSAPGLAPTRNSFLSQSKKRASPAMLGAKSRSSSSVQAPQEPSSRARPASCSSLVGAQG